MTASLPEPSGAVAAGGAHTRLPRGLLPLVALCVIPAMLAVNRGDATWGARWLFVTVSVSWSAACFFGAPLYGLSLLIGVLPGLMLLRALFVYNSVIVLLALGVGTVLLRSPEDRRQLLQPAILWLTGFALLYWLLSYAFTGYYSANLRGLELLGSAAAVVLLALHRAYLAGALFAVLLSLTAIGLALLPYGDRLGMARISDDLSIGNPIAFGLPLALVLILANADGGKWLLLQRCTARRLALSFVAGLLLLLSTSRVSWLVAAACLLLILIMHRPHRRKTALALGLVVLATIPLVQTKLGPRLIAGYERTFSVDRTLSQRTSGRLDQWILMPLVIQDLPIWGFGPGRGGPAYARYSLRDPRVRLHPGSEMKWHSLYQQITLETGVIGLLALSLSLFRLLITGYRWLRNSGEIAPLLGTVAFLLIAATVSGMDGASGLFLGFGLVTAARPRRHPFPGSAAVSSGDLTGA